MPDQLNTQLHPPQIKICGLTRPDEAAAVAELGIDAMGLVFFAKSPRNVTIEQAAEVIRAIPESVCPVGVFVNEGFEFIMERVDQCGLRGAQLHGVESQELVERLLAEGLLVYKGLFHAKEPSFAAAPGYHPTAFLVECGKGPLPGGNAESWDYGEATRLASTWPVIVAGGLDAGNVREAIQAVTPAAVDVSSGVESEPGRKDVNKAREFVEQAKSTRVHRIQPVVFR